MKQSEIKEIAVVKCYFGKLLGKKGDDRRIDSSIRRRITAVDSYLSSKSDEDAETIRSHFRMLMQETGWENCLKGDEL